MAHENSQVQTNWLDTNIPHSNLFKDTYYSKFDGRGETDHVFIKGNDLPRRWELLSSGTSKFTIGELGFGTGLNFLETIFQWKKVIKTEAMLEFISFERYPLRHDEMRLALSRWPRLEELAKKLCSQWTNDGEQFHLRFADNVNLCIYFGDANIQLPKLTPTIDAWYLDGFSPAKNPQMWNETLMAQVYQSTNPGGTLATYTVAGFVRRNLSAAGFKLCRDQGFGTKREMLTGYKISKGK